MVICRRSLTTWRRYVCTKSWSSQFNHIEEVSVLVQTGTPNEDGWKCSKISPVTAQIFDLLGDRDSFMTSRCPASLKP